MTHPSVDNFLLFSSGSQAVLQRISNGRPLSSGATCLTIEPALIKCLDGNGSGFSLSGDGLASFMGLIDNNVDRKVMRVGISINESSETGYGTISGRSFEMLTLSGLNAYRFRFDATSGSLVTQAFRSESWVDVSYQGPDNFATVGSNYLGGHTTIAGNLSVPSGMISFPPASLDPKSLRGLAPIATSGATSDLNGILALSNLPIIPITQISGLLPSMSASATALSATSLSVSGATTLNSLSASGPSTFGRLTAMDISTNTFNSGNSALGILSAGAMTVGSLHADTTNLITLNVSGAPALGGLSVTSLTVSEATALSGLTVTSFIVPGPSTLGILTATEISATTINAGASALGVLTAGATTVGSLHAVATNLTTLNVSGGTTMNALSVTSLSVLGITTLNGLAVASLTVPGPSTFGVLIATDMTVTNLTGGSSDL
jgi:hypothetical protein